MLKNIKLRQFPELDSLRFFSILLVVCHHQFPDQNIFMNWIYKYAWVGVDLFFVLSGFLITTILYKEFSTTNTINLKKFWIKRFLRLWPGWLLSLFLSYFAVYFFSRNNPELRFSLNHNCWHYLFHFANYSHGIYGKLHTLFSHYWSLAVEEHFYFIWPLMLLGLLKKKVNINLFLSILFFVPLFFRLYHGFHQANFAYIKLSTHTRFDELVAGGLLAINFKKLGNLSRMSELIITLAMFLLFYLGLVVLDDLRSPFYFSSFNFDAISIACILLIIIAMKGTSLGLRRILQVRIFSKIGILSYNIYLIHFLIIAFSYGLLTRLGISINQNFLVFLIFMLTIPAAYIMYLVIDKRIEVIKKKLV